MLLNKFYFETVFVLTLSKSERFEKLTSVQSMYVLTSEITTHIGDVVIEMVYNCIMFLFIICLIRVFIKVLEKTYSFYQISALFLH